MGDNGLQRTQKSRSDIYVWVPILQFPGEPEQAGEARRADSASKISAYNNVEGTKNTQDKKVLNSCLYALKITTQIQYMKNYRNSNDGRN